jgi:hypothetical protein
VDLSDLFSTYGVPVIVALATTLVVEYFAKPRLEARKARIIRDRQQIDEVVFAFQRAALGGGALLPDAVAHRVPQGQAMQRDQLERLETSVEAIEAAIARLPHGFVGRHDAHIAVTAKFIGFMRARIRAELGQAVVSTHEMREMTDGFGELDVYFVAHVSMRDSQEPWIKRAFTKRFLRKEMETQAAALLERWNLTVS